jgi:iron complex outermembrane receptor protein
MKRFDIGVRLIAAFGLVVCLPAASLAQQGGTSASGGNPAGQPAQDSDGAVRLRLPVLTVTAEKEPEDAQRAAVSVTAVPKSTLEAAGVRAVSEAADYAPNTFFHEFTARKLSNPRFRGIGSSPNNPGISTYIDGVPQLNANSSNIELAGVEQIEFVRGPQSALYGRNAIGGVVNVRSTRPSLTDWHGSLTAPFGNFDTRDARGAISGPIGGAGRMGVGISFGYSEREGFSQNDLTGNDLDSRAASFGKAQWLWLPSANWEARAIVSGERARDGDYALNDLGAVRSNPFHVMRDFEGHTYRDIVSPTFILRRTGGPVEIESTTGVVSWDTDDLTDLDYSPLPLTRRTNDEQSVQFTQEVRLSSAQNAPVSLSPAVALRWQAGVFVFTQDYDQDAASTFAPFVISPELPVESSSITRAALDDRGVGVYGRGTFVINERLEATLGLRADRERKSADLEAFLSCIVCLPGGPPASSERTFSDVSPQVTVAYHVSPARHMVYGTASRGFKAGGFNAAAPAGSGSYDNEHSWNYEGGIKTQWFQDRLSVNATAFYTQWRDMQLNVPDPIVPLQFYIDNAGEATTKGLELEAMARLLPGCDFFAGLGVTNARFGDGSFSNGVDVAGNKISNTPAYTADFGGQYTAAITQAASVYARAEVSIRGDYQFDDENTASQDAYSLTNFRFGARGNRLFAEAWLRNAFDTRYVPLAFAFPGGAPSGFLAEPGAPRTFGVRAGVSF